MKLTNSENLKGLEKSKGSQKIATLGPEGTFSNLAVLNYDKTAKAKIVFKRTVWDIFEAVDSGQAEKGIVPIENSVSGTIGSTLDSLMEFDLSIVDELILPIKHNLAGKGSIKDIKTVYVHPQTYSQCEKFLRKALPEAQIKETTSNAKSAMSVAKQDKSKAAITSEIAAKIYGLNVIKDNIQDNKFNVTRFIVIGKKGPKKTGRDRTSIAIYPQADRPGLLYELLGEFAKRKINLTKIESRPSKGKLGDYVFFIDLQGHKDETNIKSTFSIIEKSFFLKVLGSYPRKY